MSVYTEKGILYEEKLHSFEIRDFVNLIQEAKREVGRIYLIVK